MNPEAPLTRIFHPAIAHEATDFELRTKHENGSAKEAAQGLQIRRIDRNYGPPPLLMQPSDRPSCDFFHPFFTYFMSVFAGAAPQKAPERGQFFAYRAYKDFSLLRVLPGYGLPTLASVVLAAAVFSMRDLRRRPTGNGALSCKPDRTRVGRPLHASWRITC
jgi:hypothetical protein